MVSGSQRPSKAWPPIHPALHAGKMSHTVATLKSALPPTKIPRLVQKNHQAATTRKVTGVGGYTACLLVPTTIHGLSTKYKSLNKAKTGRWVHGSLARLAGPNDHSRTFYKIQKPEEKQILGHGHIAHRPGRASGNVGRG